MHMKRVTGEPAGDSGGGVINACESFALRHFPLDLDLIFLDFMLGTREFVTSLSRSDFSVDLANNLDADQAAT